MPLRTLSYGKASIRVLIDEDGAWLAATDLFRACRRYTDRDCLSRMEPEHLSLVTFPSDNGSSIRLTAVSPLGAVTVAARLGPPVDRILDAWVRRETGKLADEFGFPRPSVALLADGTMPVKPRVTSDDYGAWWGLKILYPRTRRYPANPDEPALCDDDTNIPPRGPADTSASIEALRALGAAAIAADPVPDR